MGVSEEEYVISLSKDELAKMPTMVYEGEIRVVDHAENIAEALEYLRREPLVGFDTETKPSFKKGQT
ncbi:MAG: 3'-5' exonuclease domain-containing protein 2, partial [Paramuribaculum sp.]|nr:3'-5' exonuclease domain-containing protein 2 [Paramuribaculum sp.]